MTARPDDAGHADPRWPHLRPLSLADLRHQLDAPDLGGDDPHAEAAARWSALLADIRSEPAQASLLTRVLAWGLSDGDLLWWALLAARLEEVLRDPARPSRALWMAERWLRERDEALRYEIFALAQAETKPTPGTLAGYAAFSSGPSLSPPDAKPAPPPEGMARGASLGALSAAAVAPDMAATGRGFDAVNLIGLELAAGGDGRAAARRALSAIGAERLGAERMGAERMGAEQMGTGA